MTHFSMPNYIPISWLYILIFLYWNLLFIQHKTLNYLSCHLAKFHISLFFLRFCDLVLHSLQTTFWIISTYIPVVLTYSSRRSDSFSWLCWFSSLCWPSDFNYEKDSKIPRKQDCKIPHKFRHQLQQSYKLYFSKTFENYSNSKIYDFTSCTLFPPGNTGGLSQKSEWQQVSSCLQDFPQYSSRP